jgi:predicted dehydrogenase
MTVPALKKVFRFLKIYGPLRTLFKVAGRSRMRIPLVWRNHGAPDIGMIGCGQYGFATMGYFISRRFGGRFRCCYDTDQPSAQSFKKAFRVPAIASKPEQIWEDPNTKLVYIASNHNSHTDYACTALAAGKDVFIEKPLAVSRPQLARLCSAISQYDGRVFAGYNRPFSGAVRYLKSHISEETDGGISLSCFVSGHLIPADHWYRNPEEGTRICGNAGHWIDLFIHMLAWRDQPDIFRISLLSANPSEADDNFCLSVATDKNDIFSLLLTARSEPFEGINETINVQHRDIICKIDDFRKLTLWKESALYKRSFWPKDVGHRLSLLQPYQTEVTRDWNEVIRSTLLMLKVTDMVREGRTEATISMTTEMQKLENLDK